MISAPSESRKSRKLPAPAGRTGGARAAKAAVVAQKSPKRSNRKNGVRSDGVSPRPSSFAQPGTKLARLITLLSRKEGATIADLMKTTGWQVHSVRGAISGTLKKKLGLVVVSEKVEAKSRVYRVISRG